MASNRVSFVATALALLSSAGLVVALSGVRPALGSSTVFVNDVKQQPSVETATPQPSVETATPRPTSIRPAALTTAPPGLSAATSLHVVHLHRFGSCRGRLDVTRDGVAFVSEENDDDEAFTLKYPEFLHALADDTLTVRSATRTYRFKVESSQGANTLQLRDLADRIALARR